MGKEDEISVATGPKKGFLEGLKRRFRYYADRLTPYNRLRWVLFLALFAAFWSRVYFSEGWYIVAYGHGIFLLNLFISFLTPQIDPELDDGPLLPTKGDDEFRPFMRRLSEYKFWASAMKATFIAIGLTISRATDVPVFWPILLFYFIVLFVLTMKRQIQHMWKHKYLPFNMGKKRYAGKKKVDPKDAGAASQDPNADAAPQAVSMGAPYPNKNN